MATLPKITKVDFPESCYYKEVTEKTQIYLHHTAGNSNAKAVFSGWTKRTDKVSTCISISGKGKSTIDGEIVQGFSSRYWGNHLGLGSKHFAAVGVTYRNLNKTSIGIEICNWGGLKEVNGKYLTYVNTEVPKDEVTKLDTPYKGYTYWHSYTDAQIQSTKELLLYWGEAYGIPLTYNADIFDITKRAYMGEKGVFTHNSVRKDKLDIYPCPRMIAMLKSL